MLQRTIRTYPTLPSLPPRGPLPPMVGVILPLARTNLVTNPSFETNTTDWGVRGGFTAIARSAAEQYHGTYSLAVLPDFGANDGAYYQGVLALTAGSVYAISAKVLGKPGLPYQLVLADSSNVTIREDNFVATGRWQWRSFVYQERTTATRRVGIIKNNSANAEFFYVDGVQVELITDGILQATTYIDGDQIGLLPGQQPPAYGWNGTPHASTSYRTILTRAGGYLVNLQQAYGFLLTGLIGLGMAVPNNVSIPYSVLDGARYLRTTKPPRTLSLPGRWQADTIDELLRNQSAMRAALDRDAVPLQQPLLLYVEPQDECGNTIGDFATVPCLYAGGLEGNESNYPVEDAAPTFTMYVPYLTGGSAGAALDPQNSVTDANRILQRSPTGVWSALGTGANNNVVHLIYGLDGTLYAGGTFTDIGGSGADYVAKWNGSAWSVLGSATALSSFVNDFAIGSDGTLYVAGNFTNAGGDANADGIATWNGSAWGALGTGLNAQGNTVAIAADGTVYAGGQFTTAGGVAANRIAKWNGSVWSALGTGMNADVTAIAIGLDGTVYAGGGFTTAGGVSAVKVAKWNGSVWSALGTGLTGGVLSVQDMVIGPDGALYIAGDFTAAGGVTAYGIARWNGSGWSSLGSGLGSGTSFVAGLLFGADGMLYAGGDFPTAGGITLPDRAARWNGSAWLPLDVDVPSTAEIYAFARRPDGTLVMGFNTSGTATSAANITATNDQPGFVYPVITINGPSSGTSRIYQLVNYTTGTGIWFNLTVSVGEVVTLVFDPQSQSFTSTFQGDITSKILPGSNTAQFYLAPGDNVLSFFAASSSVTGIVGWQRRYNGVADLVSP